MFRNAPDAPATIFFSHDEGDFIRCEGEEAAALIAYLDDETSDLLALHAPSSSDPPEPIQDNSTALPRYDYRGAATDTAVRCLEGYLVQGHLLADLLDNHGYAAARHHEIVSRIADRLSTQLVSDQVACECLVDSLVLTLDLADWRAVAERLGFPYTGPDPATEPGYTSALDPQTQLDVEEGIADLIRDVIGDEQNEYGIDEEACAHLGRLILKQVLGQLRPDLSHEP